MGSQEIEILIEKYWQGETTLEEEARLSELLNDKADLDEGKYGVIFKYKSLLKNEKPEEFDLSFLENSTRNNSESDLVPEYGPWKKWAMGLAAAIVIAIFSVSYQWPRTQTLEAQSIEMHRAYTETLAALQLVAEKLNQGNASIMEISAFDRTTKQIIHEN